MDTRFMVLNWEYFEFSTNLIRTKKKKKRKTKSTWIEFDFPTYNLKIMSSCRRSRKTILYYANHFLKKKKKKKKIHKTILCNAINLSFLTRVIGCIS